MKQLLPYLLVLGLNSWGSGNILHATALMVVVTPNAAILAADSRVISYYKDSNKGEIEIGTKIYQSGKNYFAVGGFFEDPGKKFIPNQIIHAQLQASVSFNQAIVSIAHELKISLQRRMAELKEVDPTAYNFIVSGSKENILTIAIIGSQDGRPTGYLLYFGINDSGKVMIEENIMSCPSKEYPDTAIFYSGLQGPAKDFGEGEQNAFDVIRKAITIQSQLSPNLVALPIDIIAIFENSDPIWVQQKQGCPIILN